MRGKRWFAKLLTYFNLFGGESRGSIQFLDEVAFGFPLRNDEI